MSSCCFQIPPAWAAGGTVGDCASVAMHHKYDVIALGCLGLYRSAGCLDVIFESLMRIRVDGWQLTLTHL